MIGTLANSIAVLGEALIDFIVADDGTSRPVPGGSPYNVAIGLARLGLDVSYLSPFSTDSYGDRLHNALQKEGVNTPIERRSPLPTSHAVVTIDDDGAPTFRLYRDGVADKDVTAEEIEANLPTQLSVLHTGSLAITPDQLPKIRRVLELMHDKNVVVSIDINIRLPASDDTDAYLDGVRSLLPLADIVKASDDDLAPFQWSANPRDAAERAFADMETGMLVLTLGEGGALLFAGEHRIDTSSYPVAQIEDTVGAGDAFHAALLASLCRANAISGSYSDMDPEILGHAADFACAAAAINVARVGSDPPTQEEVDAFIRSEARDRIS